MVVTYLVYSFTLPAATQETVFPHYRFLILTETEGVELKMANSQCLLLYQGQPGAGAVLIYKFPIINHCNLRYGALTKVTEHLTLQRSTIQYRNLSPSLLNTPYLHHHKKSQSSS